MSSTGIDRRAALKLTGSSLAVLTTAGMTSADDHLVRVNVGFAAGTGRETVLDLAVDVHREYAFDALTATIPESVIDHLARRSDVRYVERDGSYRALAQTVPWGVGRIGADDVHCTCGDGVDVAIIDSGIDLDHPDLSENVCAGESWVSSTADDDNGHGTSVAGVVGAVDNSEGVVGVAPCVCLHPLKVLDGTGSGSWSDIAAAIEYTADQGWEIANISFGGSDGSEVLKDACEYAWNEGVLLVAAAGNDYCSDCVSYPAAYSECIAVSATDSNDNIASFSSTGPEIELAAPGVDIYTTTSDGGYESLSGTSLAAPYVSGAGALVMSQGYSNVETRGRLRDSAEDLGLSSYEQGYGLVDAFAAVDC